MEHFSRKRSLLLAIPCGLLLLALVVISSYLSTSAVSSLSQSPNSLHPQIYDDATNVSGINCTAYSPDAFPDGVFTDKQLLRGAFLVDIVVAVYLFGVIAIVCDDFYVPALEVICQKLKLSQDVAGATFMAAGSSAPELFTSVIGVFIAKGDIGLGTIIGSAVFNLFFIIGLCGLLTSTVIHLNRWAVTRDCVCYLISVAALVGVMADRLIKWYESVILLVLYIGYIVLMFNNHKIEGYFHRRVVSGSSSERSPLLDSDKDDIYTTGTSGYTSEMEHIDSDVEVTPTHTVDRETLQDEAESPSSPFHIPRHSYPALVMWVLYLPCQTVFYFTIPNCKRAFWTRWYPVTFLMSLFWIGISSYVLVWMANNVGITFGIPDVVLGYTVLAIGNSLPDALASVIVARNGYGDMAISNSIGSNIFDILLCLGLPWFLQTTLVHLGTHSFGSEVNIYNTGSLYIALMLFGTVFMLLFLLKLARFQLGKLLGGIFLIVYSVTIAVGVFIDAYLFSSKLPGCNF